MSYIKQIAYTGIIFIPKDGMMMPVTLTKELFSRIVAHFAAFKKLGIPVPVTLEHYTNSIEGTIGYVQTVFEQKDSNGRDGLFAIIDFNAPPDQNILNAGASLESPENYMVATTGEILHHPLVAVTITPTPVIPDMSGFTLALSLDAGVPPVSATKVTTMQEQLATLIFEFLGIDPTQYEGKDTELLEFIAKGLAALRQSQAAEESIPEETPPAQTEETPAPPAVEASEEEKDKVIADLQLSLGKLRRDARLAKLNSLAEQGKLTKPAFDKAKSMYGGDLALSRDDEFNNFVQFVEANAPSVNTKSLTTAQVLQNNHQTADPIAVAQQVKYKTKQ